jgi:hypothetical protein
MAGKNKKSGVWQYFEFLNKGGTEDKTITVCNICKAQLKYLTSSTSSMTAHIFRKHGITLTPRTTGEKIKHPVTPTTLSGQLRLPEALAFRNKYTRSSFRHTDITRSIGVFLAKDMRPFSVLENTGFVNMIRVLDPKYDGRV